MTVFKRGGVYYYEFDFRGRTYKKSTGQRTKDRAERVERKVRDRLREEAHGIVTVTRDDSPSISAWAGVAFRRWPKAPKSPTQLKNRIAVCLEFWGRKPATPRKTAAVRRAGPAPDRPYHDLRLLDPILDPAWILRFEDWMTARGISGSRKNQLRSTMSMLFRIALKPAHRKTTHVESNPFAGGDRDRVRRRARVLSLDELDRWMTQAPYHLRVAIALATYAPKLRLGNILALQFGRQIDKALTTITVDDHKADATAPPLVVPIVDELRALLEFVRRQNRSAFVVEWERAGVKSVQSAVRASVLAAGLVHGRAAVDGVTFHTIRHSIATTLTKVPGLSERMRAEIMGQTIQTAQLYTHLAAQDQVAGHTEIASLLPVARAIVGGVFGGRAHGASTGGAPVLLRRVPRKRPGGTFGGSPNRHAAKSPRNTGVAAETRPKPLTRPKP